MFIATTQGLIKIERIEPLADAASSMLISSNTKCRCQISDAYNEFVNKHSGVVNHYFGAQYYRTVLSDEIDVGESWQLPLFIAHLLYSQQRFADSMVTSGDELIIATGRIDPISQRICSIEHLQQKIFRAHHQLSQMYPMAHVSCFFIPGENYRNPLPDTSLSLIPLDDIEQIFAFFQRMGTIQIVEHSHDYRLTAPNISEPNQIQKDRLEITAIYVNPWIKRSLLTVLTAILMVSFYSIFWSSKPTAMLEKRVGLDGCVSPQVRTVEFTLDSTESLPPVYLHGLCGIDFILPEAVKSVLLMADKGTLEVLTSSTSQVWRLPLPQHQATSRNYLLITSEQMLDPADRQTISKICNQTQGLIECTRRLREWSFQNDYPLIIIAHKLL